MIDTPSRPRVFNLAGSAESRARERAEGMAVLSKFTAQSIDLAPEKRPDPEAADYAAIREANQGKTGVATLLTLKETAARLKTTTNQVMGFVQDGKLIYINIGRGTVKPRYRFAEADIDDFEHLRRTREEPKSCLFSKSKARKTTVTIAGSTVIGLEELRRRRTAAKLKK